MGKYRYYFRGSETPFNNLSSAHIADNKYCTNQLLEKEGVPVPKSTYLEIAEFQANKTAEKIAHLRFPLVLKPFFNGVQGKDVLCNIKNLEQLLEYLKEYFLTHDVLLIEEFHGKLKSYRVLVFNKQVIGVVLRVPASIDGDGVHSIKELIALTNVKRKETNEFLGPIKLDNECQIRLKELGVEANYIPAKGEHIVLCYTCNATRGGTYESLGMQICKENRQLMNRVASILNLDLAGIDIECADIQKPMRESNGVIIEVNQRPSIRIHEIPLPGRTPHYVTKRIMRSFIFRHPLSYLYSLYCNKPTAFYVRTVLLVGVLGIIYILASHTPPNLNVLTELKP